MCMISLKKKVHWIKCHHFGVILNERTVKLCIELVWRRRFVISWSAVKIYYKTCILKAIMSKVLLNQHVTITSQFYYVDLTIEITVESDYYSFYFVLSYFSFPDGSTHHKCGFRFRFFFKYYKIYNMIDWVLPSSFIWLK